MDPYATSHFSNRALRHELKTLIAQDCATTAVLLSRIAEFDERRLFLADGYGSMFVYCIDGLHLCEGTASRRIYAARAARKFPVIFDMVADGRLHLTAVVMLAKYLTSGNLDGLLAAATHKSKEAIQRLIAERFPQPDLPERLEALSSTPAVTWMAPQHSPENVDAGDVLTTPVTVSQHSRENAVAGAARTQLSSPSWADQHSPENVAPAKLTPLAPQRFAFQFTGDQETRELYEDVRALLGHEIATGEMARVFKRALELAKAQLEKRKFATTDRPGHSRGSANRRHIPAPVRREVRKRDGDRCTFVSASGKRCESRTRLEFHHEEAFARGGEATVANTRILCSAHNQHEAERVFGAAFMEGKRLDAGMRRPRHALELRRGS